MKEIEDLKIGFVGFGSMGSAIAEGLIRYGGIRPENIFASAKHTGKLEKRCEELGVCACLGKDGNLNVAERSDLVFLAVKPNLVPEVMSGIRQYFAGGRRILLSIAWGCPYSFYEPLIEEGTHLLTLIPNTPVSAGSGVFAAERMNSLTDEERDLVKALLSRIGRVVTVDTNNLDIAGTIAGCGPAFAELFMEALGDAGVEFGLSRKDAYELAAGMLSGTAELQLQSGKHPGLMKDEVCSPGGATIRGVHSLENDRFRAAVMNAVSAVMKG